ncbi:MAG: DUF4258 domain-containing protein [Bacteroidota bacterium]|nr:DUF4258 domain-containing protein [Bacteroidota bacterium]
MHQFSRHFKEQMQLRNINLADAEDALNNPQSVAEEDELTVYQKLIHKNNKQYLLRIFVNELKQPPVVVTGYITSKINKYLA